MDKQFTGSLRERATLILSILEERRRDVDAVIAAVRKLERSERAAEIALVSARDLIAYFQTVDEQKRTAEEKELIRRLASPLPDAASVGAATAERDET